MLHLFQSNRLETLLEQLAAEVAHPQSKPLASETIIVQNKGMGRWISMGLASKQGICANVRFPLPAATLWELLRGVIGELPLRSAFCPEAMAFRLMDWLSKPQNLERTPTLANYLRGGGSLNAVELTPPLIGGRLGGGQVKSLEGSINAGNFMVLSRPHPNPPPWGEGTSEFNSIALGDDLRRFELAKRVADLFDQYLIYRPDWMAAWEKGETLGLGTDEQWQALLWHELVATVKEPHYGHLVDRLLRMIASGEGKNRLPERLMLFGISSLPPVFLRILNALSQHCDIALFVLNPFRLPSQEEGNPLLESLGKQGREFFDILLGHSPQVVDLFDRETTGGSLLNRLQADILDHKADLENDVAAPPFCKRGGGGDLFQATGKVRAFNPPCPPFAKGGEHFLKDKPQILASNDRSLQIHVCHSPMREVEVLHDQLLAMLADDPKLNPADIAVLTTDIALYAPYIEAVFGTAESATRIPFAIADRATTGEQALQESFIRLLDLPNSRFESEWVMDFLEQSFIRNRFELCEDDLPTIHNAVRETGIRWGRDANHRASLGLPAESRHSWREGLQRLLLGYALPRAVAEDGIPLFDETLPFDDLEGGVAQTLGRFAEFAETLMDYGIRLKSSQSLHDWITLLTEMLESLFLPSTEEENGLQRLYDALALLGELSELSDFCPAVDLSVVKRWLSRQLDMDPWGGFLTGGVTFCALMPMRSLPSKVICLLGLNDSAYPRRHQPLGFDLIALHPRMGDRSMRMEDRYLFLETILSARNILYISYVGRNIRDNGVLPPSVLVADLLDVVQAGFAMEDGGDCLGQILTTHPLQAFNPVYFLGDPKLPCFSRPWLKAANLLGKQGEKSRHAGRESEARVRRYPDHRIVNVGAGSEPASTPWQLGSGNPCRNDGTIVNSTALREAAACFFTEPLPEPEEKPVCVDLVGLAYFFSNPSRYLLRTRLGIALDAGEEAFDNREPFGLDYFDKEAVRKLALYEMHKRHPPQTSLRLASAAGTLPHGGFGRAVFAKELDIAKKAASFILPLMDLPLLEAPSLRIESEGIMLESPLYGVTREGLVEWRMQAISPRDFFNLWIRHLVLCVLTPPDVECQSRLVGEKKTHYFGPVENAEVELAKLLGHYRRGLCRPLPFFVKSAWAYAETESKKGAGIALQAAHKIWDVPVFRNGSFSGESENAYYQTVYRGGDPLDSEFESLSLEIISPVLAAMK